ncbi:MAG: hypothetical protein PVI89_01755, partial [Desulfobacteraceae bacterium]|jgi:hypothetical protein
MYSVYCRRLNQCVWRVAQATCCQPRQLVAWVAQQQEEQLHNRFDLIDNLLAFGHRQFLPVPPVKNHPLT